MFRSVALAVCCLLCLPSRSAAQPKDDFVRALIDLSQAVDGAGQPGPGVRASLDAMAKGLAEWDAAVARVEAGFKGAITGAAPAQAVRMHATLGATYVDRGRLTEALVQPDRAATLDPSFAPAQFLRGLVHARLNQSAAAATAFAAARRGDPESPTAAYLYLRAARALAATPDRAASLDVLLKAAIAGPPAPVDLAGPPLDLLDDASVEAPLFVPAAFTAGFRLVADGKYAEALASLRAAASADSTDEHARIAKADALVASRQYEAAHGVLTDTVRRYPASGQAYWRLARLSEDGADPAAALKAYEDAARQSPIAGASLVYAAIGRLQHAALRLDAAAKAYERRALLAPRSALAHLDLASVYQAQDRLDDALVEALAAVCADPANASAFAAAGQLRADGGDDTGAVALLRHAVRLDANLGPARYALGRALLRTGRGDEAREQLAAFERIQKREMDAQRQRFEENSRALESAVPKESK